MNKAESVRAKKEAYFTKLEACLNTYSSIFIVTVDNVGSNQMHQIRQKLRGTGQILMGKNTMVRKVLRQLMPTNPHYERLAPSVKGNIGFVFTKEDLKTVRTVITENRVRAPAKANALAPLDVIVPAGNTGQPPDKTAFFQALGVPTKISRGTIEIISDVHLIKAGTRVGPSEAALLNMLNISPFTYGLTIVSVFSEGALFDPKILDVEPEKMIANLVSGISTIASISLALGYPTIAAVPHLLVNGYKKVFSVAMGSEFSFEAADKLKAILSDPTKLAALAAAAAAPARSASPAGGKKEEKKVEKEEEKEESDDDMGMGLFD